MCIRHLSSDLHLERLAFECHKDVQNPKLPVYTAFKIKVQWPLLISLLILVILVIVKKKRKDI